MGSYHLNIGIFDLYLLYSYQSPIKKGPVYKIFLILLENDLPSNKDETGSILLFQTAGDA